MSDLQSEAIQDPDLGDKLGFRERILRDNFVSAYLMDYDPFKACIRVGYSTAFAKEYAIRFMEEPYVLQQIQLRETSGVTAEDDTPASRKQRIIAGLIREANYTGPGCSASARVAALAKLAAIEGLDAPKRSITELTGPDGQPLSPMSGMFVIPGIMTPEQWEEQAAAQQEKLVSAPVTETATENPVAPA